MKSKMLLTSVLLCTTLTAIAQEARYEIKSAVIKKTVEMMGQKIEGVQYIDDYGKKESATMNMPMQGVPGMFLRMRTVNMGDTVYTVNMELKTGNKVVLPEKPVNYLNLTPEVKDKYNIKELGQEDVAGKLCDKYSLEVTQMGQRVSTTIWVWKGISLKSVLSASGVSMTEMATDIQENVAVDAGHFTIPDGVVFQ